LTAEQLRAVMKALDIGANDLARFCDTDRRNVARWIKGEREVPRLLEIVFAVSLSTGMDLEEMFEVHARETWDNITAAVPE